MTNKHDDMPNNWEHEIWCDRHVNNMSGTWEQTPDVWKEGVDIQKYVRADLYTRTDTIPKQEAVDVDKMVKIYEEEREKYLGGTSDYYPNNQAAFEGAMRKALAVKSPEPSDDICPDCNNTGFVMVDNTEGECCERCMKQSDKDRVMEKIKALALAIKSDDLATDNDKYEWCNDIIVLCEQGYLKSPEPSDKDRVMDMMAEVLEYLRDENIFKDTADMHINQALQEYERLKK